MKFKAAAFLFVLCAIGVTLADDAAKPSADIDSGLIPMPDSKPKPTTTKTTTTKTTTVPPTPPPTTTIPTLPPTTPTPSPTTPTTTPTPAPTTTTPAPTTTTPAPTTTTPAPTTSTPAPTTPTPTPTTPAPPPTTPSPPAKDWIITDDNSTVCIIANMVIKVEIPYKTVTNKTVNAEFSVNNITQAAAHGKCPTGDHQTLSLTQPGVQYMFYFIRNQPGKNYTLTGVNVTIAVNNKTFPDNNMTVKWISLNHTAPVFTLPLNHSYTCAAVEALPLNGVADNVTVNATINLSNVHVQAFGNKKEPKYFTSMDCANSETPDIVPIAVGLILAGLVVVVLIAYLVGRRRAQARGYLSM